MKRVKLGRTGLEISQLALGAGPVSGLMTGDNEQRQFAVLERAVERGINWIDTAPGYGQGRSEENLGRALATLQARDRVYLATKVRVDFCQPHTIEQQVAQSVTTSLERLGGSRITLLQLHNGITRQRGDEPASITPDDILGNHGVLAAFQKLRDQRLVDFVGLTGTGHPEAMREVVRSGAFDAIQVPYHLLNPSAGQPVAPDFADTNYGQIIGDCAECKMGVLAIRVFAAGALLGQPPSAHTKVTPYFPLALYERDLQAARGLAEQAGGWPALRTRALRFALRHPHVHAAIVGFGAPEHVDEAVAAL